MRLKKLNLTVFVSALLVFATQSVAVEKEVKTKIDSKSNTVSAKKQIAGKKVERPGLDAEGYKLMTKTDCLACHQVSNKVVGPAFEEIAKKYQGDDKAVVALVKKVNAGGSGVWGPIPMTPHPGLKDEEMTAMVTWILGQLSQPQKNEVKKEEKKEKKTDKK